jgi:pyruvate, orthophosphate dikinase
MSTKMVYFFAAGKSDGDASLRSLLGGKGANLAEMATIGIPVPPGFTITTEVCDMYYKGGKQFPAGLKEQVAENLAKLEAETGKKLGDPTNPLLVSVRSGAADSMPGMMDTILNLGINDAVVEGLIKKSNNPRFAWDSYRRFIQMFADVAMDVDKENFEHALEAMKHKKGVALDTDLSSDDLKALVQEYKAIYKKIKGEDFPTDAQQQMWLSSEAVFRSWNNDRAIYYRKSNDIKGLLGTAVNIQSMVFGNMGETSGTGVCFSRNPSNGDNYFYGEYLMNAQGEDVVAGIRTPQKMSVLESRMWSDANTISEADRAANYPSLEEKMPEAYKQLVGVRDLLEKHYKDMQDMEFTIESGILYILQTRNGKRTGSAAVKMAVDMQKEGLIDDKTAVLRVKPEQLDQLLHPRFKAGVKTEIIAKGLNASPGAAVGKVVFSAKTAVEWAEQGKRVLLVRIETSPEDIQGMAVAKGILTARGGATSHAAVVARQMGKPCVAGCGALHIDYKTLQMEVGGKIIKQGEWISFDGSTGEVFLGQVETEEAVLSGAFGELMAMADKYSTMKVRANADSPKDAKIARGFGAVGIGLTRTEHMFFEGTRINSVRKMILSKNLEDRELALAELEPMQKGDFYGIFEAMEGLPVIIRLLDPPLHEFLPQSEKEQEEMAKLLGVSAEEVRQRVHQLHEFNPMLGFRGSRLGIVYPEIYKMQIRAIVDAAIELTKKGIKVVAEIMFPLIAVKQELDILVNIAKEIIAVKEAAAGVKAHILLGTMIEIPRAAITADEIAETAEFFSFGTNDLTQMTIGLSRDDSGSFLGEYVDQGIFEYEPFQVLDQTGVGRLMKMAIELGRKTKPNLEIGICGEHGGEPKTVMFCHEIGMNYVSCSPFRVPIARLAAAHAAIKALKK